MDKLFEKVGFAITVADIKETVYSLAPTVPTTRGVIWFSVVFGSVVHWLSNLLGVSDSLGALLLSLMAADFVSGIGAVIKEAADKDIKSEGLSRSALTLGILKKTGYLVLIFAASKFDVALVELISFISEPFGEFARGWASALVTLWLITIEILSCIENAARMGAPVPDFLIFAVKKAQEKIENKGNEQKEIN